MLPQWWCWQYPASQQCCHCAVATACLPASAGAALVVVLAMPGVAAVLQQWCHCTVAIACLPALASAALVVVLAMPGIAAVVQQCFRCAVPGVYSPLPS